MLHKGKIQPGSFDRYVAIYNQVKAKGAYSEAVITDVKIKDVWAVLRSESGSEDFEEKVFTLENRVYTIHADPAIVVLQNEQLFIQDDGAKYYVYSSELMGRLYLCLKAEKRV